MHNRDKTHCPRGHPYIEGNIIWDNKPNGRRGRICAACKRARENRAKYPSSRSERNHTKRTEEWRRKNPEKWAAHQAVNRAVRKGELVRPECCERCGNSGKDAVRIEASHNDYEKPLDIEWLCVWCHRAKDRKHKLPEELSP